MSFAESVFDTDRPNGASGRRPLVCAEQIPDLSNFTDEAPALQVIFFRKTLLDFCMGTIGTANACK